MRTQCVTVTVRSAHSKAISSTSASDSLPLSNAVQSQSRQLIMKNEGEIFFRALHGRMASTRLYALPLAVISLDL